MAPPLLLLLLLIPLLCISCASTLPPENYTIGTVFPLSVPGATQLMQASLHIINSHQLIPGSQFEMVVADEGSLATDALKNSLIMTGAPCNSSKVLGVVGGTGHACALLRYTICALGLKTQNLFDGFEIPQISGIATVADLSSKSAFPFFMRTALPDGQVVSAIVATIRHFGWKRVSFVSTNDDYGNAVSNAFLTGAAAANLTVELNLAVSTSATDFSGQVDSLRRASTPIVVSVVDRLAGYYFIDQAYKAGLMGEGTAWLFDASLLSNILYSLTSAPPELIDSVSNAISGHLHMMPAGGSGPLFDELVSVMRFPAELLNGFPTSTFEAFWTLANGIATIVNKGGDPTNGTLLLETMIATALPGAAGPIVFDSNGDRLGSYDIVNTVTNGGNITRTVVGKQQADGVANFTNPVVWAGSVSVPPSDTFPTASSGLPAWEWAVIGVSIFIACALVVGALLFLLYSKFHILFIPKEETHKDEFDS